MDGKAVITKLMNSSTIHEALDDQRIFTQIFMHNQKKLSRTAKGRFDTSVSETKPKAVQSGDDLEKQFETNMGILSGFIQSNRGRVFRSDKDFKELVAAIVTIINKGITGDPLALRTWDVQYGRHQSFEDLEEVMDAFYRQLFEKYGEVKQSLLCPIVLAAWIEWELNTNIHPFADGCGRSSQSLSAFFLYSLKFPLPRHASRDRYYSEMNEGLDSFIHYYYQAAEKALMLDYMCHEK